MIKCMEHVAIASREPKKLAEWYIRHLNFSFLKEIGPTVYIDDAKGAVVEFVPAETIPPPPTIRDLGLRHIAFEVDDFEGTHRELANAGVEFMSEPIIMTGMRLYFFRDPEGNFLHLVKRDEPQRET